MEICTILSGSSIFFWQYIFELIHKYPVAFILYATQKASIQDNDREIRPFYSRSILDKLFENRSPVIRYESISFQYISNRKGQ